MFSPRTLAARAAVALAGVVFALFLLEGLLRLVPLVDRWTGGDLADRLRRSGARAPRPGQGTDLGGLIRASADPEVVYELKPRLEATFQGRRVTTNAHGMRDRERSLEKPPGTFRIVGLGDSVMFGWGVDHEETYLVLVERALNERRPEGPRFETLNFAVPGYNTHLEVALFERHAARFSPDVIVVHFVKNDFDVPNFLLRPPDPWALDRSSLLDFARGRFRAGLIAIENLGRLDRRRRADVLDAYRHMAGEDAAAKALERLAKHARSRRIPVVILFGAATADQRALLERMADEHGVHLAPIRPYVEARFAAMGISGDREARRTAFRVAPHDAHPNAVGHAIYAEALLDRLEPLLPPLR